MNKKLKYSIILIIGVVTIGVIAFFVSSSHEQVKKSEGNIETPEVKVNPNFSRPEERGEYFSKLQTQEVVNILSESTDEIEKRKAAKVIGDRNIAGTLKLSSQEKESISNISEEYLQQSKSSDSNKRTEAK